MLTDLVPEMLDIAARRARAQGIANIETRVCSADDLPFEDATFDSVSVRFGYMFFPDVAKATSEFARVLEPGGRLCSSVWVKPEENPWTTIAMQAIATEAVLAPPDPDRPNMFRCAAPGYVSALYEAAGFRDVVEWDVDVELVTRSPAQYWEMISEHVSLAVAALQQVDAPARERIRATAIAKVSAFEKDGTCPGSGLGAVHRGNETRGAMSSGPASGLTGMESERVVVSKTIEATPEAVFAVLADPSAHADIDGTGWVRESLDRSRITAAGQVFRMAMCHPNHPDKDYKVANRVEVFDEPRAIAWQPGTELPETGELSFGGWIWRYDLEATGPSRTTVTLTYDWSAVPAPVREHIQFPPFGLDHLDNSLQHLSDLVI